MPSWLMAPCSATGTSPSARLPPPRFHATWSHGGRRRQSTTSAWRPGDVDFHFDAFVCFFLDDWKFDGRDGIWFDYRRTEQVLRHFAGVITPDFSTSQDFPKPWKTFNTYRMRGIWLLARQARLSGHQQRKVGHCRDVCVLLRGHPEALRRLHRHRGERPQARQESSSVRSRLEGDDPCPGAPHRHRLRLRQLPSPPPPPRCGRPRRPVRQRDQQALQQDRCRR